MSITIQLDFANPTRFCLAFSAQFQTVRHYFQTFGLTQKSPFPGLAHLFLALLHDLLTYDTYCLLLTAYCLLPTAYCLLLTAYCLLPTAYCLLLTAYCLLETHMFILVCYDIPNDRRRTKVMKTLKDYGLRVQYSVFECDLNQKQYQSLRQRLKKIVDPKQDDLRFYPINQEDIKQRLVWGANETESQRQAWYLIRNKQKE